MVLHRRRPGKQRPTLDEEGDRSHRFYPTHDLELAIVVHALKIWRPLPYGKEMWTIYGSQEYEVYIYTADLNLRQRRWLELIKDYHLGIHYHTGKANVVAEALSRRSHVNQLVVESMPFELCEEFNNLNLRIIANTEVMEMGVGSSLLQDICRGQLEDENIQEIKHKIKEENSLGFIEDDQGALWHKGRICVPNIKELKEKILHEAHKSTYSIHPGGNKMYHDLKATYWWYRMKRDVAEYVAHCDTCQIVKAEHQWPAGLLQPLQVPKWKWDKIAMDFIVGLPRTQSGYDSI
jgi:hypothetical protein